MSWGQDHGGRAAPPGPRVQRARGAEAKRTERGSQSPQARRTRRQGLQEKHPAHRAELPTAVILL